MRRALGIGVVVLVLLGVGYVVVVGVLSILLENGPELFGQGIEFVGGLALFCVFAAVVGGVLLGAQWVWEWLEYAWDRLRGY